ncbi:MAG TPA: ABC transporter permease [Longimicrobiales bacterium]|nr:ABC transporter permease [Longimicrobiales bacterium]
MKSLEWFIARRYLASRRKGRRLLSLSTFIAIGGVAVGVMALLVVIGVMTGLQRDLQEKILSGTPHIYIFDEGAGIRLGNWRAVRERVARMPGVESVSPTVFPSVMVLRSAATEYSQPGVLHGIEPGAASEPQSAVEHGIVHGEYSLGAAPGERPPGTLPGVLVGRQLAMKLALMAGDTVVVGSIENIQFHATGAMVPALREFVVTGTPTTGMYEYDNVNLYAHLADVQDLLGLPDDTIGALAVNVSDPWGARRAAIRIRDELGYPYRVDNWIDLHGSLFGALKLEKLAMAIILSLIIVVAAFNIVSLLTMVVADKRREIGILKSMGMTDGAVLRIFMMQGITIGAVGTLLGGALGWLLIVLLQRYDLIEIPADVYFIDTLPVAIDPLDVVLIVTISLIIAFGATIYPALQAAKLEPVEAIRDD